MKKNLLLALASIFLLAQAHAQTASVTPSATVFDPAGGQITFSASLAYPADVSAVGLAAKPPGATWIHVSTGGAAAPDVKPLVGETTDPTNAGSEFGWTYSSPPAGSGSFTFVLSYPAGLTGNQVITFSGHSRLNGVLTPITVAAVTLTPMPVAPAITTQPASVTVASGAAATFTVAASGVPTPTIKWQRSTNGAPFADLAADSTYTGVTTGTLTIAATTPAMHGHKFRAVATNGVPSDATSTDATLSVNFAPVISLQPSTQSVAAGSNAFFSVTASGFPALNYQWRKGGANLVNGGRISGATTAILTISNLQTGDEGVYSVVVSNGIAPNATSNNATLTLLPVGWSATHAIVGSGYVPGTGATITITSTINYTGEISALGWSTSLPAGWSYTSGAGSFNVSPAAGTIGTLNWAWTSTPASPVTFTYTVSIPATETGARTLIAMATVALPSADQVHMFATPDPLVVSPVLYHSADTSRDYAIDLNELLRVISFFNTRFTTVAGKVQTGCYKVQAGTADDFAPDPSLAAASAPGLAGLASYHSADTNKDGAIDLNELLRVISFFNTRFTTVAGKVQTGFYKPQSGTADGYAPDPTRAP